MDEKVDNSLINKDLHELGRITLAGDMVRWVMLGGNLTLSDQNSVKTHCRPIQYIFIDPDDSIGYTVKTRRTKKEKPKGE